MKSKIHVFNAVFKLPLLPQQLQYLRVVLAVGLPSARLFGTV
jgi:hypothetical protein